MVFFFNCVHFTKELNDGKGTYKIITSDCHVFVTTNIDGYLNRTWHSEAKQKRN